MKYAIIDTAIAGKPLVSSAWLTYFTDDETSCVIAAAVLNAGYLLRAGVTEIDQTQYDTHRATHTKELTYVA